MSQLSSLVSGLALVLLLSGGALPAQALTPAQGKKVVQAARTKLGTPYKIPPDGFPKNTDCSLLTQWAYRQAGIMLPRTARQQHRACRMSTEMVGALVFFDTKNSKPKEVTHVGINIGGGKMIHASSSKGVVIVSWQTPYWKNRLIGFAAP
jgi:cell wall-associated NlpC family hydrolase